MKKRILITGQGSYIGKSFINWLSQWNNYYQIDELSVRGQEWKQVDFSTYDIILHTAGLAHVSTDPKMEKLYFEVNRDLTIEVARKAKREGVKQFIFMSSIIIYGRKSVIENGQINRDTIPIPNNFYGESKLQAEEGIKLLESNEFKVVIIRPPMVYGYGSKGNYLKLSKLSRRIPIFPNIENKRSMIHIDNLCEFLRLIIKNEEQGVFFPQNKEYVSTSEMVKVISQVYKSKVKFIKIFNKILGLMTLKLNVLNKIFGNLFYEKSISFYKENYQIRDFKTSIILTEKKKAEDINNV